MNMFRRIGKIGAIAKIAAIAKIDPLAALPPPAALHKQGSIHWKSKLSIKYLTAPLRVAFLLELENGKNRDERGIDCGDPAMRGRGGARADFG
jgi:hypothetical protein